MKNWIITVVVVAGLALAALVAPDLDPPARDTSSFLDTTLEGTQRLGTSLGEIALAQCPADMPDCTRTARERYRKWLRGGYGYSRAWRAHYGRRIRHRILDIARTKWVRKYDRAFHRRAEWRDFVNGDSNSRVCVARMGFDYWNGDTSEYCRRRWYRDPARRVVKNVIVCGAQIGLAVIGSRGAAVGSRRTVVGGTGALCAWDKMP